MFCMPRAIESTRYICSRCIRVRYAQNLRRLQSQRTFSSSPLHRDNGTEQPQPEKEKKRGALSARLEQMSEEALETGGSGARKAVQEAGFDEELKRRLEERIAGANFRSQHASAFAQAELPSYGGQGTRDIAGAQAWDGTEGVEDASLRMLNDTYKPMRVPSKIPPIRGPPSRVDTGRSKNKPSSGVKLANARDRSSIYNTLKDTGMTEEEKLQYRKELKERFSPGARITPATLQGLASLANERIEDAIARGQFKNLPRGKGKHVERDHNANSPFLDTTEYLLNKIIQRQDIVPPWIEKQQELMSTAHNFRSRLRNDWKRHAARMIAATGGSLETQILRAKAYAAAETICNPSTKKVETLDAVDPQGHLSQITLTGQLKATPQTLGNTESHTHIEVQESSEDGTPPTTTGEFNITEGSESEKSASSFVRPASTPYRDPAWEANERSYLELAVANLNSIARTYNLMAPQMAQKPYYNLERELKSCFADCAPQLPGEILERATRPKVKIEVRTHKTTSLLEQTFQAPKGRVYDEDFEVKGYGFRQFWKDIFGGKKDVA